MAEIAFVVLLVIVIQLCYHLSNLRVELNTAERENTVSVMQHWLNLISPFSLCCSEVCSASYKVFTSYYQDVNGIVNIARARGGTGAPRRCKQGD